MHSTASFICNIEN